MGYKPSKQLMHLEFAEFPGLEVSATSCSIGKLIEAQNLAIQIKSNNEAEIRKTFDFLASRLVSWNVEHPELDEGDETCSRCGLAEGAPLPVTVDGLFCLDFDFVIAILMGWMQGIARVSLPKGMNLSNGAVNTEALMKQLGELQNPSKSPVPN